MPLCKYLGAGPVETAKNNKGNEYVRRRIFLLQCDKDGVPQKNLDKMLFREQVSMPERLRPNSDVFVDFDDGGYINDVTQLDDPEDPSIEAAGK